MGNKQSYNYAVEKGHDNSTLGVQWLNQQSRDWHGGILYAKTVVGEGRHNIPLTLKDVSVRNTLSNRFGMGGRDNLGVLAICMHRKTDANLMLRIAVGQTRKALADATLTIARDSGGSIQTMGDFLFLILTDETDGFVRPVRYRLLSIALLEEKGLLSPYSKSNSEKRLTRRRIKELIRADLVRWDGCMDSLRSNGVHGIDAVGAIKRALKDRSSKKRS